MYRSDGLARAHVPVQRRGIESSVKVLTSTRALLDSHRVADVRMIDISRASGVSIGSISFHFGGKENLLRQVMTRALRDTVGAVECAAPRWRTQADAAGIIAAVTTSLGHIFKRAAGVLRAIDECASDMPDCQADLADAMQTMAGHVCDALAPVVPWCSRGDVVFVSRLIVEILRDRARPSPPHGALASQRQLTTLFNAYLMRPPEGPSPSMAGGKMDIQR